MDQNFLEVEIIAMFKEIEASQEGLFDSCIISLLDPFLKLSFMEKHL